MHGSGEIRRFDHLAREGALAVAEKPSSREESKANGRVATHLVTRFMAGLVIVQWFAIGPDNPFFGVTLLGCTLSMGVAVIPLALRLPQQWFRVPASERMLHRLLAVPAFGWLLNNSGWNRHVALASRDFTITRANLPRLQLNMRAAAGAHGIAFLPHLALAALALMTGHSAGVLWILLPGIAAHLYPVLLQRWMLLRLQPLLIKAAETDPAA